jgi:uncharacterized membrane protein
MKKTKKTEKVLKTIKDFFTSSKMKTFYWQTLNGFIVVLVGTLTAINQDGVNGTVVLIIAASVSILNRITKEINKKYL